jgi:hypothetical protein
MTHARTHTHNNSAFNFDEMIAFNNRLWVEMNLLKVEVLLYILKYFNDSLSIERVWYWKGERTTDVYTTLNADTDYCKACEEVYKAAYQNNPPEINCSRSFHAMMDFISQMILTVGERNNNLVMKLAGDKVAKAQQQLADAEKELELLKERLYNRQNN